MSVRTVQSVLEQSKAAGTARMVLVGIAAHASEDMTAYPSLTKVARYANVDRRTVVRSIKCLEEIGEIVKIGRGKQGVTVYRITTGDPPTRGMPPPPGPSTSDI